MIRGLLLLSDANSRPGNRVSAGSGEQIRCQLPTER
jgi:hypothetical protein